MHTCIAIAQEGGMHRVCVRGGRGWGDVLDLGA